MLELHDLAGLIGRIDGVRRAQIKKGRDCKKNLHLRETRVLEVEWKDDPNAYAKELGEVRKEIRYKPLGKKIDGNKYYTYYDVQ